MAYVSSKEEYIEWMRYVATHYQDEPHVLATLSLIHARIEEGSDWSMRVPRSELAEMSGKAKSTFYRNWDLAAETRLIEETGSLKYKAGSRTLRTPVVKLVLPIK